ncbi:divergent polysaccharide deacetylase family protein [Sulfitobacter sp. OXR-159]|jgi:Divergent polysaccharide deacetylase|uniref:divergent polysaccharide deacteylase family protein n=1 Tax=Sulfitobacter sp. OXR-159 TaxID=3100174 RepID=UPI002AC8E93A|nr:divergent polysaccharide deacetylase family protein [Sulfitobacter sp. OXR-159]WPZ27972.1 divergent polysaccharide deacetylase family protein [Sulfitobacter sp. OXR-159]
MARGVLSGLIWGGVTCIGVAGAVSLMMPLPLPPQVGDAPGSGPAPARINVTDAGEQGRSRDSAPVLNAPAPRADVPQQDSLAALDPDTQTSASLPETGDAEGLSTPAAPEGQTPRSPGAEEPVLPNPQAMAPGVPQPVDELSISTEPAQPPAPDVADIEGAFDAPQGMEAPGVEEEEVITLPAEEVVVEEPEVEADALEETPRVEDEAPESDLSSPALEPQTTEADSPEPLEEMEVAEVDPEPADPEGDSRPAIGTPAATLTDRNTGVVINRPGATAVAEPGEADEIVVEDPRPVMVNSLAGELPEGKPLMSVVLIDDGTSVTAGSAGLAALRSFPYPLSFAVDSGLSDATERVETYREAGFEVLALVDLPQGAQPSDAETAFAATLDRIGPVVGVLEGTESGFQGSRALTDQVTDILAQSGHGLVTQDKGLNTMPKLARKAGVPADPVFRDFDSKDQTARVIRRFLDQAAFRAGQEGAVIMLGRLRPDTVSALLLWGLQDRASDVALVPVSAVLLREE